MHIYKCLSVTIRHIIMAGVHYDILIEDERRNLTQVALLILDLTPKAMRRLATLVHTSWTPRAIRCHYLRCTDKMNEQLKLTKNEKEMYMNPGDGFINCDTSFLYKIIRNYDLVIRPTHKWGAKVRVISNSGDIVETLRELRNCVVHRPHVSFREHELHNLYVDMRSIIEKMTRFTENNDLQIHIDNYLPNAY
ncbi:uncharacterized protein LOC134719517 [Mytilus trossulus]|uniref:uncharacterized protein LOC134719517 n=1 Tax=Mytilus trossulus TaxID=6551 RepID=UPI00300561C2